jgi:hypothetical protein
MTETAPAAKRRNHSWPARGVWTEFTRPGMSGSVRHKVWRCVKCGAEHLKTPTDSYRFYYHYYRANAKQPWRRITSMPECVPVALGFWADDGQASKRQQADQRNHAAGGDVT